MSTFIMSDQRKDQQAMLNRSISLDDVIHPRGCFDPNCLLPLCINMKLQKSHLETCKKKPGSCDICKKLLSSQEQGAVMTNAHALVRAPLTPVNRKNYSSMQTITSKNHEDEDISIIKVVTGDNKRQQNLPETYPCSQQIVTSSDIEQSNQKTLEQASSTAVIPHDKTAISCIFPHQEQMRPGALQFNSNLNSDIIMRNEVTQPHLEVLCNALQALNTVTKLAKSSQLELHVIPLLEQVLADMKLTALNRLKEKIRPTPLPLINTSFVMTEYRESEVSKAGNQSLPMDSSTPPTPPKPPTPPTPPTPPAPPTPPTPPTSSLPVTTAGSAVTTWQSPTTAVTSSSPMIPYKTKLNSNFDFYGDVISDEFGLDQDIMLFDFFDELIG